MAHSSNKTRQRRNVRHHGLDPLSSTVIHYNPPTIHRHPPWSTRCPLTVHSLCCCCRCCAAQCTFRLRILDWMRRGTGEVTNRDTDTHGANAWMRSLRAADSFLLPPSRTYLVAFRHCAAGALQPWTLTVSAMSPPPKKPKKRLKSIHRLSTYHHCRNQGKGLNICRCLIT